MLALCNMAESILWAQRGGGLWCLSVWAGLEWCQLHSKHTCVTVDPALGNLFTSVVIEVDHDIDVPHMLMCDSFELTANCLPHVYLTYLL